ncbi:MAG: response regulator transcription factor [Anaerolineae bacterium]|jgi:DNA-binding response OmpR family regulator
MSLRILLVEKDVTTADLLVPSLERKGYQIFIARTQRQALTRARSSHPDLLVLDVASFGANGYKVCESVQAKLDGVPTILLLEKGHAGAAGAADAFMEPPFTGRKLLYRVRKLAKNLSSREISLGPLALDPDSRLLSNGEKTVQLRPKEAELLAFFMRNPGKVLSRQELMRKIWETDYVEDTRTLSVHICWLRQKVEEEANAPRLLRTVRGVGYRFDVPGREKS